MATVDLPLFMVVEVPPAPCLAEEDPRCRVSHVKARLTGGAALASAQMLALAGCSGPTGQASWAGQRGYDGRGMTGTDYAAPRR